MPPSSYFFCIQFSQGINIFNTYRFKRLDLIQRGILIIELGIYHQGCRVITEMDCLSYLPLERFVSVDRVVSEETEGTVCTLVCALVCMLVCMR